jgi:hypothetical protein
MNLQDIKVQSFVTALDTGEKDEVKGGISVPPGCNTDLMCTDYTNCMTKMGQSENYACPCIIC